MATIKDATSAQAEISLLLIKERYYRDTAQWQIMRECYHPNNSRTWVHIQRYRGDIDGWIKATSERVKHLNTIHTITPATIDVHQDKAVSESWCTTSSTFEHQGFEYDKLSRLRLISQLEQVRTPEGLAWKIMTLECIYIRDSISPTLPLPPGRAPTFEGIQNFPKAYRCSAWLISKLGLKPEMDSPNEGNPESVIEVLARNREWLIGP